MSSLYVRKALSLLAPLALASLAMSSAQAQTAAAYADMRTWELEGVAGGNWVDPNQINQPFANALSGRSVLQTVNNTAGTMFLVTNDAQVINRAVWGTIEIKARHTDPNGNCSPSCSGFETDDDWLGFVMGYQNVSGNAAFPESYVGFTWNRASTATSPYRLPGPSVASEGIFLVRAAPPDNEGDPVGAGASIIDSDTGANTGWRFDTPYQFRILYTRGLIRVYINDVLRLEATAAQAGLTAFEPGQFGFTNASQANVIFGNIREADASELDTAPIAADDKFYYGLTWGTEGTNVFDTSTDTRATGILDNDYDPDGDAFALRVGGVDLPNDAASTTITGSQGGSFQVFGSGRVRYTAPADYQTRGPFQDSFPYTLVDEDGEHTATVTVTVQQFNTLPDDLSLTDADTGSTTDVRVDEGAAPGTIVGTVATIENSSGEIDEYDYELSNASNGAFTLNGNLLVVRDTAALGGPQTHTIVVRSTDVEGQSVSRTFSVHVDPNALPTSANASVVAAAAVPFVFGPASFPFADGDGDTLQKVLVTALPSHGTLFLDHDHDNIADLNEVLQLSFNDLASRAQLTSGLLKYLSVAAADTGSSFGFKVSDGTAYAAVASTMTIAIDADSDQDGVPNVTEGTTDTDGDGEPNHVDSDSDGDGIDDAEEGTGDTDGDGTSDFLDTDSDGDGLPDADEGNLDTDEDGTADYRDTDRDGDGVPDAVETADGTDPSDVGDSRDSDGDEVPDYVEGANGTNPSDPDDYRDTDEDGVPDYVELLDGTDPNDEQDFRDVEGDGLPDYSDSDDDNDGLSDSTEGSGDTDGDGISDYLDTDSDGDGLPDANEGGGDRDDDDVPNYRDTDSDSDGRDDASEGSGDTDQDGTPDYLDNSTDEDGDGIPDIVEGTADGDGDGVPNFRDTDSDNDGVPDVLELTGGESDLDHDGIADRYDIDQTAGVDANGDGIDDGALPDADQDGRSDLTDPDQDNDGIPDALESGAYGFDSDGDGIDDRWDADMPGASDANDDGIADDAALLDTDADGEADLRDLDSDRDGVSDAVESGALGADVDGDGIDDAFDVDFAGGGDTNGDGLRDQHGTRDVDQDGVADFRDLDSDDDGLTDVHETNGLDEDQDALLDVGGVVTSTPADRDADGIPDLRDVDSDADGVMDTAGTIYAALDVNGDGRIDAHGLDVDGDGLADATDGEPSQHGTRLDSDADGVPVERDQDDDGDGIVDSREGDGDLDEDGAVDRLDRDADNDGIPDRVEAGLMAPSGTDADRDGIDDEYGTGSGAERDSDNDGIADRLDPDSDNDGLTDALEILLVALSGGDADGDGIDDAIDVDVTGGADANGDGVDDATIRVVDTDGDGLADYRDPDTDNDGVLDGRENGDYNSDGINDRMQRETGVRTGLEGGGGGGGLQWSMLLCLLALYCARAVRTARWQAAAALVVALGALSAPSAYAGEDSEEGCRTGSEFTAGCWSAGLGWYATTLKPDASASSWKVVDDADSGYKMTVAYRFFEQWFVELGYAQMGGATLAHRNPAIEGHESVDYEAPSLLAGYLLLDPANSVNALVKVGYALLETDAADNIIDKQIENHQLVLGAGLRLRLLRRLEVQMEYEYYDKDAQLAGLSVRYAF